MPCRVPVIASGGVGTLEHLVEGVREGHASAVLAASIFHYGECTIGEAKRFMAAAGPADPARLRNSFQGGLLPAKRAQCLPFPRDEAQGRYFPRAPGSVWTKT